MTRERHSPRNPSSGPRLPATARSDLSISARRIARLSHLLETAAGVHDEADVDAVLEDIAGAVGEALGLATVVVNRYRPAWDDFVVSNVRGGEDVRAALLGSSYDRDWWLSLLDERFLRRGAYVINHGQLDWREQQGDRYVPNRAPTSDDEDWHPEDELFVPFYDSAGLLLGIFSIGDPVSGKRLTDDELDVLVAVARHAAIAVETAQERASAARHRRALQRLFAISGKLAGTLSAGAILDDVCRGIQDALEFEKVVVMLADGPSGRLMPRAAAGWGLDDPSIQVPFTLADVEGFFVPEFERHGCFLLPLEAVESRLELPKTMYRSRRNGQGAHAWNRHFLLVPLRDLDGALMGLVVADEPSDRLLPDADRLQAMRLFADQAAAALSIAARFDDVQRLADRDPLTHLLNRRPLVARLREAIEGCSAAGRPLALVFCDLDGFKEINDRLGHDVGDRSLAYVGEVLLEEQGAEGLAFRLGGDEFALVLPGLDEPSASALAATVARRLAAAGERGLPPLRASFGVVSPEPNAGVEQLLALADRRMYACKAATQRLRRAA